jgi:outer membrane receptor for ferrienterochelin and colicins
MWFRLCLKLGIGGLILFIHLSTCAQDKQIQGQILMDGIAKEGIVVQLQPGDINDTSNSGGAFTFSQLSSGSYQILVLNSGYDKIIHPIQINEEDTLKWVTLKLQESLNQLNAIVVSATRTQRKKSDAPVLVHVMDQKSLQRVQACNLSEGLKFQAGLRVETDCQTCNYTQLRMNGLPGSYSQILVNGRPLFSPLMGMYGLEQFPVNMIDRIEIIRGGGST